MNDNLWVWFQSQWAFARQQFGNAIRPKRGHSLAETLRADKRRTDFPHVQLLFPGARAREEPRQILEDDHVRRCPTLRDAQDNHWPSREPVDMFRADGWDARGNP